MNKQTFVDMLNRLTIVRAIILGFFLTSLYYFFVYDNGDGLVKQLDLQTKDIANTNRDIATTKMKLERAHDYQKSTAEMGEALNRLLSYIPEEFRAQDFMKVVSEEAKIAGLNILRIDDRGSKIPVPTDKTKRADFEELSVDILLEGSFAQQMTFLSDLTKRKQIFVVDAFAMDRQGNPSIETEFPILSFRATIKAYRYVGGKKS